MRKTLLDVVAAAREADCPIVHISSLAGEEPFIASSPCLGDAPVALIDITPDDYLGIMAEVRRQLVVEHDETLSFVMFTGGARDLRFALDRVQLPPRTIAGNVDVGGETVALYYMMDSAGQETTILYNDLQSFADIQTYWRRRGQLVRAFTEVYEPAEEDVYDLCYRLDHTTKLATFDVEAFARERGLNAKVDYKAAG